MTLRDLSPALLLAIAIPLATAVASAVTIALTHRGAEPSVPAQYHFEGAPLQQEFAAIAAARDLGLHARVELANPTTLELRLLQLPAALESQPTLILSLTHATLPQRDQRVTLRRDGSVYRGTVQPPGDGRWWLELADPERRWLWRTEASGSVSGVEFGGAARGAGS